MAFLHAPVNDDADTIGGTPSPMSDKTRNFVDAATIHDDGAAHDRDDEPLEPGIDISPYRFNMADEIARPDFRFRICGTEIVQSGGIVALSGKAKQGKTQFLTILTAVAMSGFDFGTLQRMTPPKSVLWIDTEQSPFDLQTNMTRLYNLTGWSPRTDSANHGLFIYMLRPCSPKQRVEIINKAIETHTPDFIIIDGLRDLLTDFNDVEQSNQVVTWLLQTSAALPQATIFAVLHTNDGSDKMRGHLGTELMNKCADRFDVSKKDGYFSVQHISRHMEAPGAFEFYIDSTGTYRPWSQGANDIVQPDQVAVQIFADDEALDFAELVKRYAKARVITQSAAKAELKALINAGQIRKTSGGFTHANKATI